MQKKLNEIKTAYVFSVNFMLIKKNFIQISPSHMVWKVESKISLDFWK